MQNPASLIESVMVIPSIYDGKYNGEMPYAYSLTEQKNVLLMYIHITCPIVGVIVLTHTYRTLALW